jgi:hypothetical protein
MEFWNRKMTAGAALAGLLMLPQAAMAQTKAAGKSAAKSETGYLVSLSDAAIVLSNIPAGAGGGAPPPGKAMTFTREAREGEAGAAGKAPGKVVMEGGPAGQGMRLMLGPGDVVRGADGKLTLSPEAKKRIPQDQHKHIEEALNSSAQGGGPTVVRRTVGEGGENVQVQQGKAPGTSAPLKLTDFTVDAKTKKPKELSKGEKVTVTYSEVEGKKVATKIEKAK